MHLIHDLGHPRVDFLPFKWGWVGGGCSQVAKGSSWVGVELPPQLLAPPVDAAAPEAIEALCLTLKVARQLGKIGLFTMFQWWGSAAERGTVI